MPDKSTQFVLTALQRAAGEPAGLPLFGNRAAPGLFNNAVAARHAAQRCVENGLLIAVRQESNGKSVPEKYAISDKGLDLLLAEVHPARVLNQLVNALDSHAARLDGLVSASRDIAAAVAGLKKSAIHAMTRLTATDTVPYQPPGDWKDSVLTLLTRWHSENQVQDCPLPELFRRTQQFHAALTPGRFHDALREHHEREYIYLHPWTGPLYDLPEPTYALLSGHEVVYYASRRIASSRQLSDSDF